MSVLKLGKEKCWKRKLSLFDNIQPLSYFNTSSNIEENMQPTTLQYTNTKNEFSTRIRFTLIIPFHSYLIKKFI